MLRFVRIKVPEHNCWYRVVLTANADDALLLVVHTVARQLRLYSLNIDWQAAKSGEQALNIPTLSFQHLTTTDVCAPDLDTAEDMPQMFMSMSSPELELSHLKIIPRRPEIRPENTTQPTILAVFSHLPNLYSATEMRDIPYSVLSRWELREEKPSLDPNFGQLSSKKAGVNDPKVWIYCALLSLGDDIEFLVGRANS